MGQVTAAVRQVGREIMGGGGSETGGSSAWAEAVAAAQHLEGDAIQRVTYHEACQRTLVVRCGLLEQQS